MRPNVGASQIIECWNKQWRAQAERYCEAEEQLSDKTDPHASWQRAKPPQRPDPGKESVEIGDFRIAGIDGIGTGENNERPAHASALYGGVGSALYT